MTIHGAKGLDFDHTYLVQAHQASRREGRETSTVVRVGSRWFFKLLGIPWPQWHEGLRYRDAVRRAELVRTLYVAMTRARERLVIVGDWEGRGGADSHLALLRHRRPQPPPTPTDGDGQWRWVDAAGVRWVTPPRLEAGELAPAVATDGPPLDVAGAIAEAERLEELRAAARERAARQRGGTVTGQVGAEQERKWEEEGAGRSVPASVAAAAGTAVHAVLEQLDLSAPLAAQLERWSARLPLLLAAEAEARDQAAAAARAAELLRRFERSGMAQRLEGLAAAVVAREVPVLLPAGEGGSGPLEYLTGAVDLLYREPGSEELVVVDFKTDALVGDDEIAQAATRYRRQGELYCQALRDALALPSPPHFELWFVHPGRVVRLW